MTLLPSDITWLNVGGNRVFKDHRSRNELRNRVAIASQTQVAREVIAGPFLKWDSTTPYQSRNDKLNGAAKDQ